MKLQNIKPNGGGTISIYLPPDVVQQLTQVLALGAKSASLLVTESLRLSLPSIEKKFRAGKATSLQKKGLKIRNR